ncbi:MAG: Rieske 2Fe-2S domain-containing protein [Anaerolineae bacterium]|nr:Rieske 2Fe-2S domain-containing protein [Anaerolineae bacterium]
MGKLVRVCHVEALEHDQPRCYRVENTDIFIVRHWANIHALENRCGHAGAPLHRGEYTDGLIVCALHGAAYRVESGEVEWGAILPPPMSEYSKSDNPRIRLFGELMDAIETLPIKSFPVTVQEDEVYITLES